MKKVRVQRTANIVWFYGFGFLQSLLAKESFLKLSISALKKHRVD